MSKLELKFKKLLNEFRSNSYELQYVNEILTDANQEFNNYRDNFIERKRVRLEKLNEKHSKRLKQIFSPPSKQKIKKIKEYKKSRFNSKKVFREMAKKFHPDTLPLDDPRHQEYSDIFQKTTNAIDEGNWGELFNLVEKYDIKMDDYVGAISCLELDIAEIKSEINSKKNSYAWLIYHADSCVEKERLMKAFLNQVYINYTDPS